MTLRNTELGGFMSGGIMVPDPASMPLGQSGVYWAKGGSVLPTNPNGDYGYDWYQEDDGTLLRLSLPAVTGGARYNKYAGGRVPRNGDDNLANYSEKDITFSLFQDTTVYVRVEGLVIRYFHMGSWHTAVYNCAGYAIRVDGLVDMGTVYPGRAASRGIGWEAYFDPHIGNYTNDTDMRLPLRRMNSNETAVCVHVSTVYIPPDRGAPRIGAGTGTWTSYSPMAFCCTSTHAIALTAGTHRIGLDVFCSATDNAVQPHEGHSYSSIQTLAGGTLTVSTTNMWGDDPGTGIITATGTVYTPPSGPYYYVYTQNVNATLEYTAPTGLFYWSVGGAGCAGGGGTGTGNPGGGGAGPGGGGGGCFKAGTKILMANGAQKPIELIEVGDEVVGAAIESLPVDNFDSKMLSRWNTNQLQLERRTTKVTKIQKPARFYRHFSINNGRLLITPEHPVLVLKNGTTRFVPPLHLTPGDIMVDHNGRGVVIDTIEPVMDEGNYFNFCVDGHHTYIANDIVVHNPWVGTGNIGEIGDTNKV